ncbi:MAG TPA: virulence factor, partial [Legionella sp.]|nr:virulence factor [Legionella sp.]
MVEPIDPSARKALITDEPRKMRAELEANPATMMENIYQLSWRWADFHLFIINPTFEHLVPPILIQPETIPGTNELEFVYPIHDHGCTLSTSKGNEMYDVGLSMCKLYYTIEKIIYILVERLKGGGVDTKTEVQIAFDGHELAQRKGFESIINLNYNVVITNFDPGLWGERYLQIAKRLADKGYGYPPESPREIYRQS